MVNFTVNQHTCLLLKSIAKKGKKAKCTVFFLKLGCFLLQFTDNENETHFIFKCWYASCVKRNITPKLNQKHSLTNILFLTVHFCTLLKNWSFLFIRLQYCQHKLGRLKFSKIKILVKNSYFFIKRQVECKKQFQKVCFVNLDAYDKVKSYETILSSYQDLLKYKRKICQWQNNLTLLIFHKTYLDINKDF